MLEDAIVELVDGAIKDGKVGLAQRSSLLAMGREAPGALKGYLAAIPKATLTEEERDVAVKMGADPAKVLESKKRAIADGRYPAPTQDASYAGPEPSQFKRSDY